MAVRLIQNNFVSGELSPALYGRHDLKQYFQGAASIENFIVSPIGGVTKRSGTELVDVVSSVEGSEFRLFTLLRDNTMYTKLMLYVKPGDATLFYRVAGKDERFGDEKTTDVVQIPSAEMFRRLNMKQIGDTAFFSVAGTRSFTAKIRYLDPIQVEWKQIMDKENIPPAPPFSKDSPISAGFNKDTSQGFVKSTRRYALWGVKNGVFSKPTYVDADIWLYWASGATVTLKFTPDFSKHDYYVLGVLRGAQYGAVAYFYPKTGGGRSSDAEWPGGWTQSVLPTYTDANGNIWTAGETNVDDALTSFYINETNQDGSNKHALIVNGRLTARYKYGTSPILSIQVWFGGYLKKKSGGVSSVDVFPYMGDATITLSYESNGAVKTIQRWTVNPSYSLSQQTLTVENPVNVGTYVYRITVEGADGTPIVIRGLVLNSDSAPRTYIDDNINPGNVTGQQDLITVGDNGMDCDLIDAWEQRLVMASSRNRPFTMWFSQTGDIYNFYTNRPQTPSDAFDATIPATRSSRILHIVASRWLVLFTEAGEYIVESSGSGFSLNTISIKRTSGVGACKDIVPVVTEDRILFIANDNRTVYELRYDLSQDDVIPINRSILSSHLTEGRKIIKTVYQACPEPVLWCLMDNHQLLSMTYLPEQEVYAWSHHRFSGPDGMVLEDINATGTNTEATGNTGTTGDVLLTWTSKDYAGSAFIERLRPSVTSDSPDVSDAVCKDHIGYDAEWSLVGADISAPVSARLVTMRPESPQFNTMALNKAVYDCALRVRRSGMLEIRPYIDKAPMDPKMDVPVAFASSGVQRNKTPAVDGDVVHLVNGDVKILPRAISNGNGQIEVRSSDEYPCEIQSVLYNIDVAARPE